MRRNELDYILTTMLDFRANVSDLIFTVDKPPQVEADGVLVGCPSRRRWPGSRRSRRK